MEGYVSEISLSNIWNLKFIMDDFIFDELRSIEDL